VSGIYRLRRHLLVRERRCKSVSKTREWSSVYYRTAFCEMQFFFIVHMAAVRSFKVSHLSVPNNFFIEFLVTTDTAVPVLPCVGAWCSHLTSLTPSLDEETDVKPLLLYI